MYVKPCAARPLFFIASACALIVASVGLRRTKLQLLQPIAGVRDSPLFEAWASGAARTPTTVPTTPTDTAVSPTMNRRVSRGRIGPPLAQVRRSPGWGRSFHWGDDEAGPAPPRQQH
jgi:hypothetical protein